MLANAVRICEAKFGNLLLYDGNAFRMAAMHGAPPAWDELRRREPVVRPGPNNLLSRLAARKQLQHVLDTRTEQAYVEREAAFGDSSKFPALERWSRCRCSRRRVGRRLFHLPHRSAPIHRQADRTGQKLRRSGRHCDREHAPAQRITKSLQQQTATSDVLRVISSSPGRVGDRCSSPCWRMRCGFAGPNSECSSVTTGERSRRRPRSTYRLSMLTTCVGVHTS